MAQKHLSLLFLVLPCIDALTSCPRGTVPCGATTASCAPPGKCALGSCVDGNGRSVSCNLLQTKHHESMLLGTMAMPSQGAQQQQQQTRKLWPQQAQPRWSRLLLPKLIQAGQQHPAALSSMPAPGRNTQLPPAVRRRNRRALQQLGGPLDAMMLGGLGSILGTGSASALGSLSGIDGLTSLAGMTGMGGLAGMGGGLTDLGGLAGMLGGSSSSSSNLAGLAGMGSLAGLTGGTNTLAALTGSSNNMAGFAGMPGAAGSSRSSVMGGAAGYAQQQQQQFSNARVPGALEQGYGMYGGGGSSSMTPGYSSSVTGLDSNFASNTVNGMGGTAWGAAADVSAQKGAYISSMGDTLAARGSQLHGAMNAAADPATLQRLGHAGAQLATSAAPYMQNVHSNARGVVNTLGPITVQATDDVAGLAVQAVQQFPNGMQSLASGAATAIGAATPYLLNNGNSMLDQKADALQRVAQAKQTIMHGTVVPIASAGINTAGNIGNHMGNGFADGFGEGYTAANDRRAPYSHGPSVQQQFESQPALYLPQSFSPLAAMANITYPCPRSRVNNIVAPVGTIIGPGIPCGVNLQVVPQSAVPSNRLAPAVVNVVPVASPVLPPAPAPSSPTPIPVTPLPPTGGGGTLPPVVPPIVNPSPAPGGTPPVVPPVVNPSPAPGGTPIPTTPPPTTPPDASPTPGGLPPGIVPPNVNPATPASYSTSATRPNYMSVSEWSQYNLPGSVPVVQVTGPYSNMGEAAARTYSAGSRMRGSGSVLAQQQQQQQQKQWASGGGVWG